MKADQADKAKEDIDLKHLLKLTTVLIVVLLFAAMVPAVSAADNDNGVVFTEANEMVYAITAVNIRTGPSTAYSKIGMLSYGEAIHRVAVGENGWSKVVYNGETAYMFSEYLSTSRPVVAAPNVDYSELSRQIAIANGLREAEYTGESWNALSDALAQAIRALSSDSQTTVDRSNSALDTAIAGLVKLDRSMLEKSLGAASDLVAGDMNNDVWFRLVEAVNNGKAQLNSNDQDAVNAAAAQIDELLAQVKAIVEAQNTPKIVTKEVMVEVPPTDDYCNIPAHRVWPVLFFCSLALNVVLVAVIVVYVSRKKKNQRDDTPLVDYDISDDVF